MQTQLQSFKIERHRENSENTNRAHIGCSVLLPLTALTRIALAHMQSTLTIVPRNTFDSKRPALPIECYKLSKTHITVPRAFGYTRACACGIVEDKRADGVGLSPSIFCGELTTIQQEAFDKSCAALSQREQSCILTLPCGFGKTVVALRIAHQLGKRTLVVVHKDFLLTQWKDRLSQFIPSAKVSVLRGSKQADKDSDFVIAMLQTLCIRLEDSSSHAAAIIANCGLAVIDEAHHMAARCFSRLFFNLPVKRILGLTATPRRKDGCTAILHMFMGEPSLVVESSQTRGEAPLVRFVKYSSLCPNASRDLTPGHVQKLKTQLTQDTNRNDVICNILVELRSSNRQVLCLSDRLAHLSVLLDMYKGRSSQDQKTTLYVGGQKSKERLFAEHECSVIFGTYAMAQEGLDIPRLDTLVLASPASDITQAVGRVLRPCSTKQTPMIVDIQDDLCSQFDIQNTTRIRHYTRQNFDLGNESLFKLKASHGQTQSHGSEEAGDPTEMEHRQKRARVQ